MAKKIKRMKGRNRRIKKIIIINKEKKINKNNEKSFKKNKKMKKKINKTIIILKNP